MIHELRNRASIGIQGILPGGCIPIENFGPYDSVYDVAIAYNGGPVPKPRNLNDEAFTDARTRMEETIRLYKNGLFPFIVPVGTYEDIELMRRLGIEKGIPDDSLVLPKRYSLNTVQNLLTALEVIPKDKRKLAHIAGKVQIHRVKLTVDHTGVDSEQNDGYFPVDDSYTGTWLGISGLREYIACLGTRFDLVR